ncbi:hypothetical protein Aperf_G00000097672 [Anoplocephala perfoliata]
MVDIPVNRRRGYSNDRQLAVRRSDDRLERSGFGFDAFEEMHRQFENMERQLIDFRPFDMFPFSETSSSSWFRQINEEMRRAHNEMMRFMQDSGLSRDLENFWQFPSIADCFTKDENGQTVFRTKFNLQAFDPEDIEVRVDNQTLSVNAKHTQRTSNSSSGQYFRRAMLLPEGVRTEEMKSRLDKSMTANMQLRNGVLTVEAPAPGVEIEKLGPSRVTRIPIEESGRRRRIHDRSIGKLRPKARKEGVRENVREGRDGTRHLNVSMPIDDVYDQKDISIQCGGGRLVVEGNNGDDHFTRAFYVPEDVDPEKLEAKLKNGVLTITGPIP